MCIMEQRVHSKVDEICVNVDFKITHHKNRFPQHSTKLQKFPPKNNENNMIKIYQNESLHT